MKNKPTIAIAIVLMLFGSVPRAQAMADKKNIKTYTLDLNADGVKEIIEVENKLPEGLAELKIKSRAKPKEAVDRISIPGKVSAVEMVDFNTDGQQYIVVHFDSPPNAPGIFVYRFKDNKLHKIFAASSEYGVDTDFSTVPRIKVGKAPRNTASQNFSPDWDVWVWVGDRFIKE